MFVVEVTEEFFVAVVGTVDDMRVAAAGNVLLVLFDWRVAWDDVREFFDDCCWDIWELLFERLTVYWFGCGTLVGMDRFELFLIKKKEIFGFFGK